MAHTSTDAPPRPSSLVAQRPPQRLKPGMMMIERYKKLQEAKAAAEAQSWPQPSSTPHRTASAPFPTSSGTEKKRIAHVPNVVGLLSGKPKATPAISPALPTSSAGQQQQSVQQQKTLGNNVVRRPGVPNKPAPTKLPRPMIAIELGCRVPATIRQKYLNILVDETLKIYDREEDAYERAVEEEKQSYAKCSSKVVYVNVITNVVQRIRREAESTSNPTSSSQGKSNLFFKILILNLKFL